jgi:hypothetical protein
MLKEKMEEKKLTLLGIEPTALIFNVIAYLNTPQSGGNALGW